MLDLAWRPRAHLDRESIAIYLGVECGNPPAALAAVQRIDAAVERARALPHAGGRFHMEGLDAKEYRTVHANPYTVFYRFDRHDARRVPRSAPATEHRHAFPRRSAGMNPSAARAPLQRSLNNASFPVRRIRRNAQRPQRNLN